MDEVANYIKENFGLDIQARPFDKQALSKLPLYLKGNFDLHAGQIGNLNFAWAKVENKAGLTPEQLRKQGDQLRNYLGLPVIYVFNKLESWQRKRIIEKKIAFVQPFKQIYIPDLFLQLNEINRNTSDEPVADYLSFPAQFTLLYHLQIASLERKFFQEIAEILHYSAMTITRTMKEFKRLNLLTVEEGKEKSIRFNLKGKALWENALTQMRSPIREIWYSDKYPDNNYFKTSGEPALAVYSMINEGNQQTFAIGKDEFRHLKAQGIIQKLDKKFGDYKIEVWHYNPAVLTEHRAADKLSLYLSMKGEEDERIQRALNDMINEIQW